MFDIKKISNDKTSLAAFLSLLTLGMLAFLLLIKYDLGNFNRLNKTIRETKNNIDTLENLVEHKAYICRFNERFAEKRGPDWLMEVLAKLAKEESITFSTIKPIQPRSVAGYKIISVEGDGIVSYTNLFRLLRRIEDCSGYIFVERLSIIPALDSSEAFNRNMPPAWTPSNMQEPENLAYRNGDVSSLGLNNVRMTISSIGTEA